MSLLSRQSFSSQPEKLLPLAKSDTGFVTPSEINPSKTSSDTPIEVSSEPVYSIRRWLILSSYCFLTFVNGVTWVTYSTIAEEAKTYYSVSNTDIFWFLWQFNVIFVVVSFPCSQLIARSLYVSVILGSLVMMVGGWVRYFAYREYAIALLGQGMISLATSLILAAPNTIANTFFPERERFFTITMGSSMNVLGTGFGYLFSSQFVAENPGNIEKLLFVSAIMVSIPTVFSFLIIKGNKGDKSSKPKEREGLNLWPSLLLLLKNKHYIVANLAFSICNTNIWNLLTIIDIFLQNDGISSTTTGIICLVLVISGFISGLVATLFLRYSSNPKKHFDRIIKFLFLLYTLAYIVISALITLGTELPALIICVIFLGIGGFGLQPFQYEALEEIGRPVFEAVSVNGFFFLVNVIGLPLGFISTIPALGNNGLWILSGSVVPSTIYILFFYKTL